MAEFKDSSTGLVADVDCTADDSKELCQEVGVKGYPTIKHGDPHDLQDYQGGRNLADFRSFAKANLGPQCGPRNVDLCDDKKKAKIAKFSAMSAVELDDFIQTGKDKLEKVEAKFKAFVSGLDTQMNEVAKDKQDALQQKLRIEYKKKNDKKEAIVAKIKASGLGLAKMVKAFTASSNTEL